MQTRRKLAPGQNGTKRYVEQYGERLVCVRYRYDEQNHLRHKTIELIVETVAWHPKPLQFAPADLVGVRVALKEVDLQRKIKQVGGRWNPGE